MHFVIDLFIFIDSLSKGLKLVVSFIRKGMVEKCYAQYKYIKMCI